MGMDDKLLLEIAKRPFDGSFRQGVRRGRGSRRNFIKSVLRNAGLRPFEDKYGNVWAESGKRGPVRLLSSHMDIDPSTIRANPRIRLKTHPTHGRCYQGILDNAVGCYLNLRIAAANKKGRKTLHVFTASEELVRNRNVYAMSAKEVVRQLKSKKLRPSVCIAIDVTYPNMKVPGRNLHEVYDFCDSNQLFDARDRVQGYIDGITGRTARKAQKRASEMIRQYKQSYYWGKVKVRDFPCWDEAQEYSRIAPSFAFGPVGYGKFDEPDQLLPRKNLHTAYRFLKHMTAVT